MTPISSRFFISTNHFQMYLCYIDESGTPQIPGNTSHYILAGITIPIGKWKSCEQDINRIKNTYKLTNAEIHTGWLLRNYTEQNKIRNFNSLDYNTRIYEVNKYRNVDLLKLQKSKNRWLYKQKKKNYSQTKNYIHLAHHERMSFVEEIAKTIGNWNFARLFAECIDKIHFNPAKSNLSIDEQTFEQIVSRFERFLKVIDHVHPTYGMLIHDNNETVAKKHTELMKNFHKSGTFWTSIENIIETPLFVNSQLTSMIQIADVCAYSLRRYLENRNEKLFDHIFKRADRKDGIAVGVRHFTNFYCDCKICKAHKLQA